MNEILSNDGIFHMLKFVKIYHWTETEYSHLDNLRTCPDCHVNNIDTCNHLHFDELEGIKILMLVCDLWNNIINDYFYFECISEGSI
jgi:hypothetical protein